MKKTIRTALSAAILILAALMIVGTASASTPGGATITNGTTSTTTAPTSSGYNVSQGGYITEITVTGGNQQTSNWTGYYGNVSGGKIYLNDSSGSMYSWDSYASNGGWVYATTKTSAPNWTAVTSVGIATLDTIWGWGSKSDNISRTYTSTGNVRIAGVSVTGASKTTVNNSFNDYAVSDYTTSPTLKAQIIWAAAISDNTANYKGTWSDYQLLIPAGASEGYYFYLEIL